MLKNPLIQRYRYSLLRPSHVLIYLTIYISVVLTLLFTNYTLYIYQNTFRSPQDLCIGIYFQFLAFQIIVLLFWGAASSASAVKEEIKGKTYDFFRMLPLSAYQKTTGILIGKNLVVLFLGAINCLFLVFFGTIGGLSANLQIQVLFVLFSIAILVNSLALLSSLNAANATEPNAFATLAIVLIIFACGFILIIPLEGISEIGEFETIIAKFFMIEIPLLVLVSLISLYFSFWIIKGILRKFTSEDEPIFTRDDALIFMLGFELILLGLFHYCLVPSKTHPTNINFSYMYWAISLFAALFIPFEHRSFDRYLEYMALMQEQYGSKLNSISRILLHSNISLALGLFVIWSAFAAGIILISRMEFLPELYKIWILFTFYIFLTLLSELDTLYRPLSKKIRYLLGFIAAVYVILPLILGAIFESRVIVAHSPFGIFMAIVETPYTRMPSLTSVWGSNIILSVIPIMLIRKRYIHILKLRRKM